MASTTLMCCGYQVTSFTTNVQRSDTPMITLLRMGSDDRGFLTPDEARKLAGLLIEAAKAAEALP